MNDTFSSFFSQLVVVGCAFGSSNRRREGGEGVRRGGGGGFGYFDTATVLCYASGGVGHVENAGINW